MNTIDFFSEYAFCYSDIEDDYRIRSIDRRVLSQKVEIRKVLKSKQPKPMPDPLFQKSIDMISSFLDSCNAEIDIPINSIEFDPFVDDSISIPFPKKHARINLYFNEECPVDEENFDEVYFSFIHNKQRYLVNDTMANIIPLVKQILSR